MKHEVITMLSKLYHFGFIKAIDMLTAGSSVAKRLVAKSCLAGFPAKQPFRH